MNNVAKVHEESSIPLRDMDDLEFRDHRQSIASKRNMMITSSFVVGFVIVFLLLFRAYVPPAYITPAFFILLALYGLCHLGIFHYKKKLAPYDAEDLARSVAFFTDMATLEDSEEMKALDKSQSAALGEKKKFHIKDVLIAREVVQAYRKYDAIPPIGYVKLSKVTLPKQQA